MCGISGILDLRGSSPSGELLQRMIRTLRHRGPDGRGVYVDRGCGLAHARLSILDLAGGAQPMQLEQDGLAITFNGEVFNYLELREELEREHGRRFATRSDTETILHAYAVWGERCVERMNGQWAFAIWDARRQRLFCARDRIGVRPFFWTLHEGRFLFASEVKALFACPGVTRAFDLRGLNEVLTFWCAAAPRTVWEGISELPPGCTLTIEAGPGASGRIEPKRYWQLDYTSDDSQQADASAEKLIELLVDAARLRLRADVPVGAYLSGGLDSSVIAGIVKRRTDTRLQTFSVTFEDPDYDESDYQREVVELLGTQHDTVRASNELIGGVFPELAWFMETPVVRTAPAPLYVLAGLVRKSGYKVVLTGEGSDEMLGGYDIFKEAKVRRFCAQQPDSKLRPQLLRSLYPYLKSLQAQPDAYLRAFFHARAEDLQNPFFSHLPRWKLTQQIRGMFSKETKAALAGHDPLEELRARLPREYASWHPFAQAQYLESTILLPGYILSSQGDRPAMGQSIEGRYPFLDARVMDWAAHLPPRLKMKGLDEKHVLKRAARGLVPERVLARPKQPYRAPDAASFIDPSTGKSRYPYVDELLSETSVGMTGVFDPASVTKLVDKVRSGSATGVKDNMAFVSVLSTQLVAQRFLDRFESEVTASDSAHP
ncbi:MAG: asparagine synthase (glutamine-hydrolyzing) [Planctomycetes bacterium]|nr:asparagine synthase (glutamine-hydrolyzing) [Planctomycetota bacterium]